MKARRPLTVAERMTPSPAVIEAGQTLADAHRLMARRRIRHLPVVASGRLIGIVSLRDLHLLETLQDVEPDSVGVEEAMTPLPYTVRPSALLIAVVRRMARKKLGSAVVVERGAVVGVFTTTDALTLLGELL